MPDPGSRPDGRPERKAALAAIAVAAGLLLAHKVILCAGDPFFVGDTAHRMNFARLPVAALDNRIWLPFLQIHICAAYHAGLPVPAFKLIPCFYFFLAVGVLGLAAYGFTRSSRHGLLFSLLVMVCFAYHASVAPFSVRLYQEIPGTALFFLLIGAGALDLRRSKWLLLVGAAAMLTRENFWIYLCMLSLLLGNKILRDRSLRSAFLFLWGIPVLWLLSILVGYLFLEGRWPDFPTEWPLTVNKQGNEAVGSLAASAKHLWQSLVSGKALYLAGAVAVAWALGGFRSRSGRDPFRAVFVWFSLSSLVAMFGLIFLFDPWQATTGNTRMAVLLIEHGFIWALLAYRETGGYPGKRRMLARAVLVAGLVLGITAEGTAWRPEDHSGDRRVHAEIRGLVERLGRDRTPVVCLVEDSYWTAIRRFVAPTLQAYRSYSPSGTEPYVLRSDVIVVSAEAAFRPPAPYVLFGRYVVEDAWYEVYWKDRIPPAGQ